MGTGALPPVFDDVPAPAAAALAYDERPMAARELDDQNSAGEHGRRAAS